jgi:hypothetical protein
MYMRVRDIKFAYFYDFSIEFWNFFDNVILFSPFNYKLWKSNYDDVPQADLKLQSFKKKMGAVRN